MPTDEYGIRAELMVDPASVPHRMNVGQLYEAEINRCSEFVRRRLEVLVNAGDITTAWTMLIDYLNDVNPVYAQIVMDARRIPSHQAALLKEWISDRIYVNVPPGLKTITPESIVALVDKWGSHATPVTFVERQESTGVVKKFTTTAPASIGMKYIYLLYKLPDPTAPGVAYTSQHGIPIRPTTRARYSCPISTTPLRFGEDEIRIQIKSISPTHPFESPRLLNLMSNSPTGVRVAAKEILTSADPIRIRRMPISTKDLITSSAILGQIHHMFGTVGIDSVNTAVVRKAK